MFRRDALPPLPDSAARVTSHMCRPSRKSVRAQQYDTTQLVIIFNASTNVARRSPYLRHYAAVHLMIIVIGVWTRFHLRFYGSEKFMGSHGVYME
jgi:hypothetical protein